MSADLENLSESIDIPDGIFRLVLESMLDVVLLLDADRKLVFTNSEGGYAPLRRFIGHDLLAFVPKRLQEYASDCFEKVIATEKPVVLERQRVDGPGDSKRYYEAKWIPIVVEGEVEFVALFAEDVTDRARNEHELARSQERYRQLVENSLDLITIFGEDLKIRFVTPNITEFVGYTPEEMLEKDMFDIVHTDDVALVEAKVRAVLSSDTAETIELTLVHREGHHIPIEARGRITESEKERLLIVNSRDIRQRKESETLRQNLIRADKLAAVGQLAAGVAHEINNPAAFISTNLYVLQELLGELTDAHRKLEAFFDDALPPNVVGEWREQTQELLDDAHAMVETNLSGMERITRIVRDLRTYARDEPERIERIDVNEAVATSLNMMRGQIEYVARLDVELADELPTAWAEAGRVSQVVMNLLANATHAVTAREARDGLSVTVRTFREGPNIVISVTDNGIGMTKETERRLFEPFYSTKEPDFGTGLGLWLSKEIVESFRGSLTYETEPGKGATFEVRLPTRRVQTGEHRRIDTPTRTLGRPLRVLLIDDDDVVLESYVRVLERRYEVTAALGSKEALTILAQDDRFDAVLCDLDMPDFDGRAIYEHLRRAAPELVKRCVFTTSGAFSAQHRSFMTAIANPVIHKPISTERLRELLVIAAHTARDY